MYRNSSYEESLAKELKDREFAQGFILDLLKGPDGLTIEQALRHTIQRMGVAEYCARTKKTKQYVNNFLTSKRPIKPETLDAFLKPFGLRIRLVAEKAS